MSTFRYLITTIIAWAFLVSGFVAPASAQDQIISTFDGVYAAEDKLAGYTTSVSVLPGEALKLRVRSVGTWAVKIVRIGSYSGGDGRVVDSVSGQAAVSQPALKLVGTPLPSKVAVPSIIL